MSEVVRGKVPGPAYFDPLNGRLDIRTCRVLAVSADGRILTIKEGGKRLKVYWADVYPPEACEILPEGQVRVRRYSWHPTVAYGPVCADLSFVFNAQLPPLRLE